MWHAIVYKKTGELYSLGSVIAKSIPKEFEVIELGENFDQEQVGETIEWDVKALSFVDIPPPPVFPTKTERIRSILDDMKLDKTTQDKLEQILKEKL